MPSQPEQGDGSRHLLWDLEQETPNHNASTNPERVRVNLAVLSVRICSHRWVLRFIQPLL
ncbi:hypothetical protein PCANC_19669 [Puccinia coronata f. sp. avenae]|uniref:Uncharacterized protein n=1 Tax=Puccinia coronata f. sp. avenae TaxID=200324 RepID=A0A2N5SAU0_9BASI|nr:hypothetical protein PCANC_19669 [Puccinia coronata f. sp. avenae]